MKYDPLIELSGQTYCWKKQKKENENLNKELEQTKENPCPSWRATAPFLLENEGKKQERGTILPIEYLFWKPLERTTPCGHKEWTGLMKNIMEDVNTWEPNGNWEKKPQKKINNIKTIIYILISFMILSPSLRFLYSLLDSTKNPYNGTPIDSFFTYIKKEKDSDKIRKRYKIKKNIPLYSYSCIFNRFNTNEFFLICMNQRFDLLKLMNFFGRYLMKPSTIFMYSIFFAFYNFTFSTTFVLPPPIGIISTYSLYSIALYFRYIYNGTYSSILLSISFNVKPQTTIKICCGSKPLEGLDPTESIKLWNKKNRLKNKKIEQGTKMWKQVKFGYRSNYTITLCFRILYTFGFSIFTTSTSFYPTFPFYTIINKIKKLQGYALTSLPLFSAPPIFPFFWFFITFLFFNQFFHIYGQTQFNTISASYYTVIFTPWYGSFMTRNKKTILELQPEKIDKTIKANTICPQEGVREHTQEVKIMEKNDRKVEQASKDVTIGEGMKKHKIIFLSRPLIFFKFEKIKLLEQKIKVKNPHQAFVHTFMLTRYSAWENWTIGWNCVLKQIPPFVNIPSYWITNPLFSVAMEEHSSKCMNPSRKNVKKNKMCTQTNKGEHTPSSVFFNVFFTLVRHTPLQMWYKTQKKTDKDKTRYKQKAKKSKKTEVCIRKKRKIGKKEYGNVLRIYLLIASFLTGYAPLLINVDPNPDTGLDPQLVREKDKPKERTHILVKNVCNSLPIIFKDSDVKWETFMFIPLYVTNVYCENMYKSTKMFNITLDFRNLNCDIKFIKKLENKRNQCKKEPIRNSKIYESYTLFPYVWFFPIKPEEKR